MLWNLYRLAECLLPLAPQASLEQALATFEPALHREFPAAITRRLGLQSKGVEQDGALAKAVWTFLHESKAPFEQTFFDWYGGDLSTARAKKKPVSRRSMTKHPSNKFEHALSAFEPAPGLRLDHPYFARQTPCTMLIDEVEALWAPIAAEDNWSSLTTKLGDIRNMAEAYGSAFD